VKDKLKMCFNSLIYRLAHFN